MILPIIQKKKDFKKKNSIFFFYIKKMSQILPEPNDDFSGDFFEVNYVFLCQNLKILGFYR